MNAMTTTEVKVPNEPIKTILPEFGRFKDVEHLFGIKRGTLYNLLADGKVKSVSMRRKGNKNGCRLFYLPGISEYLLSLLNNQNTTANHANN
jgi:hypothetical protein